MTRTRNRSCTGKRAYTKAEATQVARHRLGRYRAYGCKFCGRWHVGHGGKPRKRR